MNARLRRILGIAVLAVLLPGCYRGAIAAADESAPAVAAVDTPAPSRDCGGIVQHNDAVEPTLKNLSAFAKDVVVGVVQKAGDPYWNSKTGGPPTESDRSGPGNEFQILTPYEVAVDQALVGERQNGALTVVVEGGRIGCYFHTVDPPVEMPIGQRLVVFLMDKTSTDGAKSFDYPQAWRSMAVDATGKVATPLDGAVSLDALVIDLGLELGSPAP